MVLVQSIFCVRPNEYLIFTAGEGGESRRYAAGVRGKSGSRTEAFVFYCVVLFSCAVFFCALLAVL